MLMLLSEIYREYHHIFINLQQEQQRLESVQEAKDFPFDDVPSILKLVGPNLLACWLTPYSFYGGHS